MNTSFDYFGLPELPYLILCNPNKEAIYFVGLAYDQKMSTRLNALSDFTFSFPKSIDGGTTSIEAYDYLNNKRLVFVEGYGYFQITNVVEKLDGMSPYKTVTCQSLEVELTNKRLTAYSGTKQLYNILSPTNSIIYQMCQLAPNWSVGTVDASLTSLYRTFDVSDSNIYKFLVEDVSKAFECVFIFDTVNRTISAKAIANVTTPTDVFISLDNLIENSDFSEKSDEITTCLSVYGGGNLTIRGVNPLGTEKIYNFDYYANADWMSSGLISAIGTWKALLASKQAIYTSTLSTLKAENALLLSLEATLSTLEAEYTALETQQKVRIEQGLPYSDITALMTAKQNQIDNQKILISNKELLIVSINSSLSAITTQVSFAVNFTPSQLSELNNFIYENTYQNKNIIQTDNMTLVEIQDAQTDLFNQGTSVLARVSQPRYEFSVSTVNFTVIPEFSVFTSQTQPGVTMTIEVRDGSFITAVLLEISQVFDNPSDFTMKFSNRLRLDNGDFVYSDLLGQIVETGSSVSFNSGIWGNWDNNYKDDVTSFITSSLDASANEVINSTNQEIKLGKNGLRGRTVKTSGAGYEPTQVWLTSSILAFTDDNWASSKLALGKVTMGGTTAFGLVADFLVGRMIAGNTLTISNSGPSGIVNFRLDNTGAYLNNANLFLTRGSSRIYLDPTNGIKIQKNSGGTWTDMFRAETNGDLTFLGKLQGATGTFTGSITANSGSIGGWTINSDGISDTSGYGNYIKSNGDIHLGALRIQGNTSTFDGDVYANRIFGTIQNSQIGTGLDATKMTFGTIGSNVITSGEIQWGGDVRMYPGGYGWAIIQTPRLDIRRPDLTASIGLDNNTVSLDSHQAILITGRTTIELMSDSIYVSKYSSGQDGFGQTVNIDPSSTTSMEFVNGILVSYS